MESYLKRRILGAVVTVIVLAIAMPVVLDSTRHLDLLESDVPVMPDIPDWVYDVDYEKTRQDARELASGEAEAKLQAPEKKVVKQNAPAAEDIAADKAGNDANQVPYAWTLQVGAFQDKANAEQLISKLRQKGYKAYSDVFAEEALVRVYVGPEIKREDIEALQTTLQKELKQTDIHIKRWLPGQ